MPPIELVRGDRDRRLELQSALPVEHDLVTASSTSTRSPTPNFFGATAITSMVALPSAAKAASARRPPDQAERRGRFGGRPLRAAALTEGGQSFTR